MRALSAFLLSCCLLAASCSRDVSIPIVPEAVSDSLHIIEVNDDSLYFGEHTHLVARNMGSDTSRLKIYVGRTLGRIDSLVADRLYFVIPRDAESGFVKLVKDDSLVAYSPTPMRIFAAHVEDFLYSKTWVIPTRGYRADLIQIIADRLPPANRIQLTLGGRPLIFDRIDTKTLTTRVPLYATTGLLQMKVFDMTVFAQSFEVLPDTGMLLPESTLSDLRIEANRLTGFIQRKYTFNEENETEVKPGVTFADAPPEFGRIERLPQGDTIRFSSTTELHGDNITIDITLVPTKDVNMVSGTIGYTISRTDGDNWSSEKLAITLKNARWEKQGQGYVLQAIGLDIKDLVTGIIRQKRQHSDGYHMEEDLINYRGAAGPDSWVRIYLTP